MTWEVWRAEDVLLIAAVARVEVVVVLDSIRAEIKN